MGWQLGRISLIHGWNLCLVKIYCCSCWWQNCALSVCTVSLHSKKKMLPWQTNQLPFVHTFPKKAMIFRHTAVPTSWRAGGSHLKQSHQKSVALGTCHSFEARWELVTLSQKWECSRGREEMLFVQNWESFMHKELFPTCRRPQHQLQTKPTRLLEDLCFISFFKYKWKRFTCRVTWGKFRVSVCFSP